MGKDRSMKKCKEVYKECFIKMIVWYIIGLLCIIIFLALIPPVSIGIAIILALVEMNLWKEIKSITALELQKSDELYGKIKPSEAYNKYIENENAKKEAERKRLEKEATRQKELEEREAARQAKLKEINENPEERERLTKMCIDIQSEIGDLLKNYKGLTVDADLNRMKWILKECYRKISVIEGLKNLTIECELDVYDEYEKIEKKARSLVNSYIKSERENGSEDYEIEVDLEFSQDLWFISDYLWEKDEKLHKDL